MSSQGPRRCVRGKRKLIKGEDVSNISTTYEGWQKRQRSQRSKSKTQSTVPTPELPDPTLEKGCGHFAGAHDFVINNLTMSEGALQVNKRRKEALEWLANHVIRGAELDSSERDPLPCCHPQTCLALRNKVLEWLRDPERKTSIFWLHGPAGVGKSAIIQTLAESEKSLKTLGAAVFLRTNHRNNVNKLLPTVAYQLAVKLPPYQDFICEQMEADPLLLERGMVEQFSKLIIEPFASRKICADSLTLSIFLDGLDECQSEAAQCEVIELVGDFVRTHPTVPLTWTISSRPEAHLQVAFSPENIKSNYIKEYIPVDSEQACRDVEQYLRVEFESIRRRYPYSVPSTSEWPTESQILVLANAASSLFAFAATLTRFIGDENFGDPVSQLDLVLLVLDRLEPTAMVGNPLAALDELYSEILSRIPDLVLSVTKRILSYVLVRSSHAGPSSFIYACNLLNLKQNVAYGALQKLHSVVRVPSPELADSTPLCIYHASFADYLCNRSRSQKFWIDLEKAPNDIWRCYSRILQQARIDGPKQVPNVTLSWQPIDSHLTAQDLFREAKNYWAHQILPDPGGYEGRFKDRRPGQGRMRLQCHIPPTIQPYDRAFVWLKTSVLYSVIQQIDFSRLYHGYLCHSPDEWGHYVYFLRWLFEMRSHPKLKCKNVVEVLCLSDVDLGRVIINRINYPPRIHYVLGEWVLNISPDASLEDTWEFHDKEALKERLQSQKEQNPSSPCAIWGVDPLQKCLMVECNRMPRDIEGDDFFESEMFLLPYI